jgi:hypothetical protein
MTCRTVGRSKRVPRQPRIVYPFEPKFLVGLHVIAQLDPFEWNVTTLEKVADGVSGGTTALAVEADGGSLLHDARIRTQLLALAQQWEHVAKTHEFVASLERFLLDQQNDTLPIEVERLPKEPPSGP